MPEGRLVQTIVEEFCPAPDCGGLDSIIPYHVLETEDGGRFLIGTTHCRREEEGQRLARKLRPGTQIEYESFGGTLFALRTKREGFKLDRPGYQSLKFIGGVSVSSD